MREGASSLKPKSAFFDASQSFSNLNYKKELCLMSNGLPKGQFLFRIGATLVPFGCRAQAGHPARPRVPKHRSEFAFLASACLR